MIVTRWSIGAAYAFAAAMSIAAAILTAFLPDVTGTTTTLQLARVDAIDPSSQCLPSIATSC